MRSWTDEQKEAIYKSGTNIIVSAGAGSGKTAVLTERVIEKLKSGIHINELLILTFTKAAAAEMKERIRKEISKIPFLSEELALIDSSYITTFDSFALSVVKKYHYAINISNSVNISDSSIIMLEKKKIIDKIFDEYYLSEDETFSKLIYDFCTKDDKTIKASIIKIADKLELKIDKERFLDEYSKNFFNSAFLEKVKKDYQELIEKRKEEIKEQLEELSYLVPTDYYLRVSISLENLLKEESLDLLFNMGIKLPSLPRNSEDEVKACKKLLSKKVENLLELKSYGTEEEIEENILLTRDTTNIIIEILKKYFILLDEYKKENEVYDFQDIALMAIKLLKENRSIRESLRDTFKEIMVDEYQDTNDIQEEFISLISNNNVYMVGDIKQSIYRFRNANPYIFKNKYDSYSRNVDGAKIDLLSNFRSRDEVLNNINKIFNYIMDETLGGADYINSHQMRYGNKSYEIEGKTEQDYNMEFLEYDNDTVYSTEEVEIFTIGRDIKNKIDNKYQIFDKDTKTLHDATYNDFVILLDRSTDFDLYKKIFEYLGIPLSVYKDEKLNDANDFYIIKNIVDILIHIKEDNLDTTFKYDFISLARSYLYALPDNDIFEFFLNNNFKDSLIYQDLVDIAKSIDYKTIYEILENVIEKLHLYEMLATTKDVKKSMVIIHKILETAKNLSLTGYTIYDYDEYLHALLEEKYDMKYSVNDTSSDAVRIMTIHKSKGLEYNVCYFAGLKKGFNISDLKERFLFDNNYGLVVPLFKEGIRQTVLKELVKEEYLQEEISEKIRLFYVALTRAKEKMIFVIPSVLESPLHKNNYGVITLPTRSRYRSFLDIVVSIKKELKSYIKQVDIGSLNINRDYLYHKENIFKEYEETKLVVQELEIESINLTHKSFSKKNNELITKEVKDNMALGLKIHETLELIDFKEPDFALIDSDFIKEKIIKFLENPLLENIKEAKIYKEYEFMFMENGEEYHGIIDLMLKYDNHIDIIDYKLNNILDEEYVKQLNGYKNYIASISNKPINLYLYSIIGEKITPIDTLQ